MACYNIGAGPVNTPAGRAMLRKVADLMDFVVVRDTASRDILRGIGCRNPRIGVAADAALNAEPCDRQTARAALRRAGLDPAAETLALNVNAYLGSWSGAGAATATRREFVGAYVRAANRVLEKVNAQAAVVATQHADVPLSRQVLSGLRSSRPVALITNVDHDHREIRGVLGEMGLLFAMRLHSIILASSALTPVAGLGYQPKVHHYFQTIGMPELCLGFDRFSEDAMAAHLLAAWENRAGLRERLGRAIPGLKRRALLTADLVACLHRGEDLDAGFRRLFG
jgi:polysaccharide pyruvyl transferase WcaK-like protein